MQPIFTEKKRWNYFFTYSYVINKNNYICENIKRANMTKEMQKVYETKIVSLDRDSKEYKAVMSEFLRIEVQEKGEEVANQFFESVNSEFCNGTNTIYKFDDGLVRNVIQLNFLSPTFIPDTFDYSNHIQNWSLFACEQNDEIILLQSMELTTFCMHEGEH
jgi:hypothetical protein